MDDAPVADWTPPTREEWERVQSEKVRASAEARDRRKWLMAAGFSPRTGERLQPEEPDVTAPAVQQDDQQAQAANPADLKRAVEKAVTEAQLTGRRQMRTFAVGFNKALTEAGWNGQRLDSLMKLIDVDDVDFDGGEIVGLAEQLDGLKSEWPEFFRRTRNSANAANGAGGSGQNGVTGAKVEAADKPAPKPEPKGWAEQVADKILRG
ncbi:hypothetical protein [Streptomyces sp. NPDC060027]|uniref:phage scaffolding protein n=1 Tax=Streptomyces sp. NPDC060027 TaxID=3347040 RepID=UPI0036B4B673